MRTNVHAPCQKVARQVNEFNMRRIAKLSCPPLYFKTVSMVVQDILDNISQGKIKI